MPNNLPENINNVIKATTEKNFSIKKSRNIADYRIITATGQQMSLYARRIHSYTTMLVKPKDGSFFDYCISLNDLADVLNMDAKNLKKKINISGTIGANDVLNELYNASLVCTTDDGKVGIIHLYSCCMYDPDSKLVFFRFDEEMRDILLIQKKFFEYPYIDVISLHSVDAVEVYEMIMNKLTELEKASEVNYERREIRLFIKDIREKTFTQEKYKENHKFISTFLKRICIDISKSTCIEIEDVKSDKEGNDAVEVIMGVKRKKKSEELIVKKELKEFSDSKLNDCFVRFLSFVNTDFDNEYVIELHRKHLIELAGTNSDNEDNIDVDMAIRIIEQSIRRGWKDFYPLSDNNTKKEDIISRDDKEKSKKLKDLENYYLYGNGSVTVNED